MSDEPGHTMTGHLAMRGKLHVVRALDPHAHGCTLYRYTVLGWDYGVSVHGESASSRTLSTSQVMTELHGTPGPIVFIGATADIGLLRAWANEQRLTVLA